MEIVSICSGGLDSTVLYYYLVSQGHKVVPLNFFYGSKHNERERQAAREIFEDLLEINIDLSFLSSSSLINKDKQIPAGHYEDASMKSTVVPFRNGIMLSYAVAIAEDRGMNAVAIGNHKGDHSVYPDCRPDFIDSFSWATHYGTYNEIDLLAPFTTAKKQELVTLGVSLCVPLELTWSCYEGCEIHCGKCGTCTERREAFKNAGEEDKTNYVLS